jgi:splicing factor 1
MIPNYKPPSDYRRPQRTQEKIYIPVNDYPEINFIGLLIGPRGKTLKQMEARSGAKIAIRGKGSVKEGKGRTDVPYQQTMDDDLHCLITGDSEEKILKAIDLVNNVIETAASVPEAQNEHKRGQLRELAALNGTLRDDEGQPCANCGERGHRRFECPNRNNFTASIICRICGGQGHFARDCKERPSARATNNWNDHQPTDNKSAADREFEQLMMELGSSGSGVNRPSVGAIGSGPSGGSRDSKDSAPWQRGSSNGRGGFNDRPSQSYNDRPSQQYNGSHGMGRWNGAPSMPSMPPMASNFPYPSYQQQQQQQQHQQQHQQQPQQQQHQQSRYR